MIALKACRNCAFGKHRLGTKMEFDIAIDTLDAVGKILQCHEYTERTWCAGHCAKLGIKGKRRDRKGDKAHLYTNMPKQQMLKRGLGGHNDYWKEDAFYE